MYGVQSTEYEYSVCLTPHVLQVAQVAQIAQVDRRLLLSCRSDRLLRSAEYGDSPAVRIHVHRPHQAPCPFYSVLSTLRTQYIRTLLLTRFPSSQARHYCIMNYHCIIISLVFHSSMSPLPLSLPFLPALGAKRLAIRLARRFRNTQILNGSELVLFRLRLSPLLGKGERGKGKGVHLAFVRIEPDL